MPIKSRLDVECPTCGADPGQHCIKLAKNRYHQARLLRFYLRPCGCVVYRHDGEVRTPCFRFGHRSGERHPDMVWSAEKGRFVFPD